MMRTYFLVNNMEVLSQQFALGICRKKTRLQAKQDKRKALYERIKKKQRDEDQRINKMYKRLGIPRPLEPCLFHLKPKRWFLLTGLPNHVDVFMYHLGDTFHQVLTRICHKIRIGQDVQQYIALRRLAKKNQRVRSGFEALARIWIRRRIRAGNEEDLLTGSVPETPIILVDWKVRRHYVFEPQTILKDMVTRLQMSYCDVFPKPHFPRNPYTNTDMTAGQFFSVVKQLRSVGMAHWTLEALYSVQYNLRVFEKEMYLKLKNTILHGLFANHHSVAGIEVVLDFIEEEHAAHHMHCDHQLYRWALENAPLAPRITAWRNLCYKHYRISNRIPPHPDADSIAVESRSLCGRPVALENIRNKATGRAA